jgi:putative Mg2+ transporter-C (MgtC) family protein
MVVRVLAGAALGGVIGYERDRHGRPVGLRTHLIVALSAATFMLVSTQFIYFQHYTDADHVEVDTSRIAAAIVSAIGFIAAGAILRTGMTVQGVTTAAGLWLVTAVGMCSGAGMFAIATIVTATGLLALTVLRRFEYKANDLIRRRVSVVLAAGDADLRQVTEALRNLGAAVTDVESEKHFDGSSERFSASFDVDLRQSVATADLIDAVGTVAGVRSVHVRHPS